MIAFNVWSDNSNKKKPRSSITSNSNINSTRLRDNKATKTRDTSIGMLTNRPISSKASTSGDEKAKISSSRLNSTLSSKKTIEKTSKNHKSAVSLNRKQTLPSNIFDNHKTAGKYQIKEEIGKGSFAVVNMAINFETGDKFAIKNYNKLKLDDEKRKVVQREISILERINHPNIVKLIEKIENVRSVNVLRLKIDSPCYGIFRKTYSFATLEKSTKE